MGLRDLDKPRGYENMKIRMLDEAR